MNPLEFLKGYADGVGTRLRNVIAGDGYLDSDLNVTKPTRNQGRGITNKNQMLQFEATDPHYIKRECKRSRQR